MANYSEQSPYSKTNIQGDYLDLMKHRTIALDETDEAYTIESKYSMRPDLLSYDRYGTSKYWWVFTLRNKDTIIDPIQDFKTGTTIRIPNIDNIR